MVAQLDRAYLRRRPTKGLVRLLSYVLFEGRPLTTRGRWINPLVLLWLRSLARLPPLREVRRPIFILGTGRSGTTVLGKVLSMHRSIGFLNEPKALWHCVHPAEDLIGNYSLGEARVRLDAEEATPAVQSRARSLYASYLLLTGSSRVLDKYPAMIFRVSFLRAIFPDCRLVILVRNGRDTCASISAWSDRHKIGHGDTNQDWWGLDRRKWKLLVEQLVPDEPLLSGLQPALERLSRQTDMAAVEWILTMREALRLQPRHPSSVRLVRYEELLRDPESALRSIQDFCELEPDERFVEYGVETLRPAPQRPAVAVDPVIRPAYEATMRDLGYL